MKTEFVDLLFCFFGVTNRLKNELMGSNHQTTNSESRIFLTNIYYDFFFNWQTEKQNCFEPIRILLSFSTAQTEKNSWKNWEYKIRCLVVRSYELDMSKMFRARPKTTFYYWISHFEPCPKRLVQNNLDASKIVLDL